MSDTSISSVSSVSSVTVSELSELEDEPCKRQRLPRVFRERTEPFELYSNDEFKTRFGLSKETFLIVLHQIEENIQPLTSRNKPISAKNQLLLALRFYVTGAFQNVVGDHFQIAKSTTCRIIHKVTHEIALLRNRYITMPNNEQRNSVCSEFFKINGFPNVCGAIDCIHVRIQSPGGDSAEVFRNREDWFSINVQIICDSKLRIMDIVARHPGSCRERYIFNNSLIRTKFENNKFGSCYLLGDLAYPCRRYLLTPVSQLQTPAEKKYNKAHLATHNPIKRTFRLLKERFACLSNKLRISLDKSLAVIVATCVLHNICINHGDNLDMENEQVVEGPELNQHRTHRDVYNTVRNAVIRDVFTRQVL